MQSSRFNFRMAGNTNERAGSLEYMMAGLCTNADGESTANSFTAGQLMQYHTPRLPAFDPFPRSSEDVIPYPTERRVQSQVHSQEQEGHLATANLREG